MNKKLIFFLIFAISTAFSETIGIKTCFTPGGNCAVLIANEINKSTQSVNIQAYHLTNKIIIDALDRAKKRGVLIFVLLDKQAKKETSPLVKDGFNVLIDNKPKIAHNKVMIIDTHVVITGSFNFTESAQKSNAENVIVIDNMTVAKKYTDNFIKRFNASIDL